MELDSLCPLCKKPNLCALAADNKAASCWCQATTISAERIVMANNAGEQQRCICQQCALDRNKTTEAQQGK